MPPLGAAATHPPVRPRAFARMLALEAHVPAFRPLAIFECERQPAAEQNNASRTREKPHCRGRRHQEDAHRYQCGADRLDLLDLVPSFSQRHCDQMGRPCYIRKTAADLPAPCPGVPHQSALERAEEIYRLPSLHFPALVRPFVKRNVCRRRDRIGHGPRAAQTARAPNSGRFALSTSPRRAVKDGAGGSYGCTCRHGRVPWA